MPWGVVVRAARRGEEAARAALLRGSLAHSYVETCLYFFCQELTLQCCVLGGAVLFIFLGVEPLSCGLLLPGAIAVVALAVYCTNIHLVEKQLQAMRCELAGWVAEVQSDNGRTQVVGTVSVSRDGRLHSLHVAPAWRGRGVARALLGAVRGHAAGAGLPRLEAATSELQAAARACLHAVGWQLTGTYRRRVLGSALTLPVARLHLDLPHA